MGYYLGRLIIRRIFESEIWGAYFRKGSFFSWGRGQGGGLIIGILQYSASALKEYIVIKKYMRDGRTGRLNCS